jgi:uncharacterized membrane protein YbhN (UPF0104 family)
MTRPARRWLRPAIGAVVAALFVWLLAHRVDWGSVGHLLASAAPAPLVLGLAFFAAGIAVRVVRWWWMLREFEPGLRPVRCARPFLVSLALNNTMPLRAGDLARAFGFRGALRSPPGRILGTLVIERVLDLVVLLALFFLGLVGAARGVVPPAYVTAGGVAGAAGIAALVALVLAPAYVARTLERWQARLAGRELLARLAGAAAQFFEALGTLQSPLRAAQLLALSVLAWTLEGGMYASVAWSLHAGVAPFGPWFAAATGTLATLLPSSPGYVGTFDYFAMLGLTAYGATRAVGAAFALLVHLILWVPVTLVGGALLLTGKQADAIGRAGPAPAGAGPFPSSPTTPA